MTTRVPSHTRACDKSRKTDMIMVACYAKAVIVVTSYAKLPWSLARVLAASRRRRPVG